MLTLGDWERAYQCYDMLENIYNNSQKLIRNKAVMLLRLGRADDALGEIRRNFEYDSVVADQVVEVDIVMDSIIVGDIYRKMGLLDKAIQIYASIISHIGVDSNYWGALHYSIGICNFRAGRWVLAWEGLEYRGEYPVAGLHGVPRWAGQPVRGGLVVYAEQGKGDAIMMARFYENIKIPDAKITFLVHRELETLFKYSFPSLQIESVLSIHSGEFSFICPDLSLPFNLGVELVPSERYLKNPGERFTNMDDGYIRRFRVGVAWNGSPKNPMDAIRSINMNDFLRIFEGLNVDLYCLVPREMCACEEVVLPDNVIVPTTVDDDFSVMADLIASMDLIVSVDSAPAHLAGALGVPVWLLLASVADWRWRDRSSDWYLSMRIFRQEPAAGTNWEGVIAEVREQLIHLLSETFMDRA